MKFKVSSKALYSTLSAVSKVINAKNTLTILDCFLWEVSGDKLTITASDSENTLTSTVGTTDCDGEGRLCVNARRICDVAKELPDVDVDIDINEATLAIKIQFPGGSFDMMGIAADQYPQTVESMDGEETLQLTASAKQIINGIDNTLFAVSTDRYRPQLTGTLWDIREDSIIFVSADNRKLVRYSDGTTRPGITASCIIQVKPSVIMKNLFAKEETVKATLSPHSAVFHTETTTFTTRFIKGKYPDYNRVIPNNNPFVLTVDRNSLLTAVRRVSVCSDPSHGLIKFRLTPNRMEMKVDDPNVGSFAYEEMPCDFTGDELTIGFSAPHLMEILNTLSTDNIIIRLADKSRAGVFTPDVNDDDTDLTMVLTPITFQDF